MRCQKTSLRAFISWIAGMALSRMLGVFSIGAPIGAGRRSRQIHYHSFLGVAPQTPHQPASNGMEEPPKCTILRFNCQNFPPQKQQEGAHPFPNLPLCVLHMAIYAMQIPYFSICSKKVKICSKHFQVGQPCAR